MKLWDKGYSVNSLVEAFTVGRDREFDLLLAGPDALGNMAHLLMLNSIGLISDEDTAALKKALRKIYKRIEAGDFAIDERMEDIHSQIEYLLTEMCGDAGKRIHTGRSRNDQVMVDIKLFCRARLIELLERTEKLFGLLTGKAAEYADALMPGYTHQQIAMPSSFGLWFGAYAESLADDLLPMKAAWGIVNTNPLGSGAGYGSSIPLDRRMTSDLLGFDDLAYNSVYAQMQRGRTEKAMLVAIASVASTLGKLAADVCLFSGGNFDFVKLPDAFTTGSSIMPHKKNPDVFELVRAKCNRIQAAPNEITLLTANLTSGYARDLQLTKDILFPAIGEIFACIDITAAALAEMEINRDILDDDRYKYLFTVEDVNDMVSAGIPFREAYRTIGMQVQSGSYAHDGRALGHTHAGSVGNLCLSDIKAKFGGRKWDYSAAVAAEKKLMSGKVSTDTRRY